MFYIVIFILETVNGVMTIPLEFFNLQIYGKNLFFSSFYYRKSGCAIAHPLELFIANSKKLLYKNLFTIYNVDTTLGDLYNATT